MFKTYVISPDVGLDYVEQELASQSEVVYAPSATEDDIIADAQEADALISIYEPITRRVIDNLPNLKFISVASIGFDMVDVAYAKEKEILVSNNPNYCVEEVADHALAMMLALNRKLIAYNNHVKQDKKWQYDAFGNTLHRMATRTLGLVGFGSIARKVAQRIQAFGSQVIVYDPFLSAEVVSQAGARLVTIEELLAESDIISVHMPLNDSTRHFFDAAKFSQMKRQPIFINCARGEIVDEEALHHALEQGVVSAAGLDVLSSENPDLENNPLLARDNVILTPHMAFYSQEAMEESQTFAAKHILHFMKGELDKIPLLTR